MEARIELRRKDFKKTFDDPRRRRGEQQVQIRKQNRSAQLTKKRQAAFETLDDKAPAAVCDLSNLPEMVAKLASNDPTDQFLSCQQLRKLLSIENNPPIQQVIDAKVIPRCVEFLTDHSRPELQFEAAWALTNVASGNQEQTTAVVKEGAIPIFVNLLSSPREDVSEQAIWALGNIAGDCSELRDLVLQCQGLPPLLEQLRAALASRTKPSLLRNAAWTLSNLCRGSPKPQLDWVRDSLPVLKELLNVTDIDVLTDSSWALCYLTDGPHVVSRDGIEAVLQSGVAARLVQLLCHTSCNVQIPVLRTVGNIVTGNESQTETMIVSGCLPALKVLLSASRKLLRKEACWTVSNITAGNQHQIQAVIEAGIIPILIEMAPSVESEVKREIYWALGNAASGASAEQVQTLVHWGIIESLCDSLESQNDLRLVEAALQALDNVLGVGQQLQAETGNSVNPYVVLVEECKGFPKLEQLQYFPEKSTIYQAVLKLMTTYMNYELEGELTSQPGTEFQTAESVQMDQSAEQQRYNFDS